MNDNDSTEEIEELLEDSLEEDLDEAVEDGEEDIEDSDDLEDEDDFSGDEEDEADEDLEDDEEIEDDEEDSEEEEPAEEDKPIKAASDGEFNAKDYFAASQIPGTPEYTEALIIAAQEYVKKQTGDDEYDPFDPKHAAIYNQACNKIDRVATNAFEEKTQQLKEQRATQLSFKKAEEKIDSILPTPELVEKFENTIGDMKTRDFKKLQDAAAKGDFSGFIEIAERVSQASEKVRRVKNRNQPAPKPKQGKKSKAKRKVIRRERDVDIEYGGVSDMLGL
jgi:hypothetical protein